MAAEAAGSTSALKIYYYGKDRDSILTTPLSKHWQTSGIVKLFVFSMKFFEFKLLFEITRTVNFRDFTETVNSGASGKNVCPRKKTLHNTALIILIRKKKKCHYCTTDFAFIACVMDYTYRIPKLLVSLFSKNYCRPRFFLLDKLFCQFYSLIITLLLFLNGTMAGLRHPELYNQGKPKIQRFCYKE
jgi:hypothetical protein